MAFEQSMDLDSIKKSDELSQKKMGGQKKYGFGISKDVGNLRQRNHGCFNNVWIWIIVVVLIYSKNKWLQYTSKANKIMKFTIL